MAVQLPVSVVGQVVGPGDRLLALPETGAVRLAAGLSTIDDHVSSNRAGVLKQTRKGQLYLEGRQKRYLPAEGDNVIGVITDKHSENFLVDIGGPFSAILPQLSFEGATKRNRPNLATGDLVYARVAAASRDTDPVLTCIDALGRAAGYGHLKEGIVFPVSTAHARHLLGTPAAPVLQGLGGKLQFEVAVGVNGRVWVAAGSPPTVVVVSNAIREAEFKTPAQVATMCSRLLEGFS